MNAVYIKSAHHTWFARITEGQAEIFRINHLSDYAHEKNTCAANIQTWLFQTLAGSSYYQVSTAEEFNEARKLFIQYAISLSTADSISMS